MKRSLNFDRRGWGWSYCFLYVWLFELLGRRTRSDDCWSDRLRRHHRSRWHGFVHRTSRDDTTVSMTGLVSSAWNLFFMVHSIIQWSMIPFLSHRFDRHEWMTWRQRSAIVSFRFQFSVKWLYLFRVGTIAKKEIPCCCYVDAYFWGKWNDRLQILTRLEHVVSLKTWEKIESWIGRIADRLSQDVVSSPILVLWSTFEQSFVLFEACHCGHSMTYFLCTSSIILAFAN